MRYPTYAIACAGLLSTSPVQASMVTFESSVGVGAHSRSFRYTDVASDTALLPLTLPVAPVASARVLFGAPINEESSLIIGTRASYVGPLRLRAPEGTQGYEALNWTADLAYQRQWLGLLFRPTLGYELNSAWTEFQLATTAFPSLHYEFLFGGANVRSEGDSVILDMGVTYGFATRTRGVHSTAWFPEVSARVLRAEALFGLRLYREMGVLMRLEFEQIGLDFNPLPTSLPLAERAGGATDRAIQFTVEPFLWLSRHN